MSERPVKRKNRKPSFLWQGVLILAPMLVLAKLGALAIWQDKRMAEHEADLRAQDLAEQVAGTLASTWSVHHPSNAESIVTDLNGNLLRPQPVRSESGDDEQNLNSEQSKLFREARAAEFVGADPRNAIVLFQRLLDTGPPTACAQQARYSLGLLFLSARDTTNATRVFHELLRDPYPAFGDAGGDLKTLSLLKLASLSQASFEAACSNAVANPTPLTSQILRATFRKGSPDARQAAERWWSAWQADEFKRRLHTQLRASFRTNPLSANTNTFRFMTNRPVEPPPWLWIGGTNEEQLAQAITDGDAEMLASDPRIKTNKWAATNESFVMRLKSADQIRISGRLDTSRFIEKQSDTSGYAFSISTAASIANWVSAQLDSLRVAQYFGVSVSIGNYDVIRPEDLPAVVRSGGGKGAGMIWTETHGRDAPRALATASRVDGDGVPFLARVHLVGPDLLFEQQSARSRWFAMVIAVAALTCIIGFVSAYRAFHKQLRLAELKSNFVSSVSHELRAPIASVRLMAEGLERGKISEPAKQREYFRFITQECRRLSSMIENVLDFARIEQGRKQYEFEPTDVRALVEQTVKLMEPYAAERGVRLLSSFECRISNVENAERGMRRAESVPGGLIVSTVESNPPSPWGEGRGEGDRCVANLDGQAIQQALVNLIDNAIKHSPSGEEVVVTLNAQPSTLNISVADHGPGIPLAEHEKIFERFYRLGSELRRETPGVGIGLSIVNHIVEAHSGCVRVESEVGKGSRFTIELPFTAVAQRREENI